MSSSFDPNDLRLARQAALQHLARRDHCKAELALKLIRQGFDKTAAAEVATALEQEKVIDDARFVENFVSYQAEHGLGPVRIRHKLKSPNLELDPELISRFIDNGQDWVARARDVREKKFGPAMPQTNTDQIKQAYFLQYRGFPAAQIRLALGTDIDIDEDTDDEQEEN